MAAVIGLVGRLASGKGTAAKYLAERHSAAIVRYSDALREALGLFDMPISRENMQDLSTILRQRFGENVLAKAVARKARAAGGRLVVVDGVRRMTDIEGLGDLPGFCLVALELDQATRYRRCVQRNENDGDSTMSFEGFLERDVAETEVQIPDVAARAKFTLDNSGSLEDLYRELDRIVSDVSVRPQATFGQGDNSGNG